MCEIVTRASEMTYTVSSGALNSTQTKLGAVHILYNHM